MTYDEFSAKLFEKAKKSCEWWVDVLNTIDTSNAIVVSETISNLEAFYQQKFGDRIRVAVLTSGSIESSKGGVITNFTEHKSPYYSAITAELGEIDYYFPFLKFVDNKVRSEADSPIGIFSSLFHEGLHIRLQGNHYWKVIRDAEKREAIIDEVVFLQQYHPPYMNIIMELITQYITGYVSSKLVDSPVFKQTEESKGIFEFNWDFGVFKKFTDAILKGFLYVDNLGGANRKLIDQWESAVKALPDEFVAERDRIREEMSKQSVKPNSTPPRHHTDTVFNLYKTAFALDRSLLERYLHSGRAIDVEFVEQLFRLEQTYRLTHLTNAADD